MTWTIRRRYIRSSEIFRGKTYKNKEDAKIILMIMEDLKPSSIYIRSIERF